MFFLYLILYFFWFNQKKTHPKKRALYSYCSTDYLSIEPKTRFMKEFKASFLSVPFLTSL